MNCSSFYHKLARKTSLVLLWSFFCVQTVFAKTPSDPYYQYQEHIWNQINAPEAWEYSVGSHRVVVAVIDVGVDTDHPELEGNLWVNKDEIPNNGRDDDNNGYIDDINGWNFVENDNSADVPKVGYGDRLEVISHGTVVAGLIGGAADNGYGGVGVNRSVSIMSLRAIENGGDGSFTNVEKAIDYAVNNGADIISLSLVSTYNDDFFRSALERAYEKGILVVSAAGNENEVLSYKGDLDQHPQYPICFDKNSGKNFVLGVTSVNLSDELSIFADYGSCVDLSAPGEYIDSSVYYKPSAGFDKYFDGYFSGTSFSVPLVSGSAALLKSIRPDWSAKELTDALKTSAFDNKSLNLGFADKIGDGRLDLGKAAKYAFDGLPDSVAGMNPIYFVRDNEVYAYDIFSQEEEYLTRFYNTEIKSLAISDINNDDLAELILLIKRGDYDFVRISDLKGKLLKEFPVEGGDNKKIKFFVPSNGEDSFFVLESEADDGFLLKAYDFSGEKIREAKIVEARDWDLSADGDLVLLFLKNNQMVLRRQDWRGEVKKEWIGKRADEIYGFRAGKIWGGENNEYAVLYIEGEHVYNLIVDMESGAWFEKEAGSRENAMDWKMFLGSYGRSILVYNDKDEVFTAENGKGRYVGQIRLPNANLLEIPRLR